MTEQVSAAVVRKVAPRTLPVLPETPEAWPPVLDRLVPAAAEPVLV